MANWSKNSADKIHAGRGILRKLLPGGVWHFHVRNEDGQWVSRSTRHRDKPGAIQWAEAFSMGLTKKEFGIAPPPVRADDSIEPALNSWLDYQKFQNTACTHRSYRSVVKKFKKFLAGQPSIQRLRHVTTDTMLEYRQWAVGLGNDKVTVDNNLIVLRSFFSWAKAKNLVGCNPVSQQPHGVRIFFDAESPRKETYAVTEYASVRTAAHGVNQAVFVILANTGLRSTELAMLEWSDIDRPNNLLHVRRKTTADGQTFIPKDKTDRTVPLTPAVRATLDQLAAPGGRAGYVIPLPEVKSRPDYFERTFLERLKGLAAAAGIDKSKLTLHNFRRFFVSQCADSNIPLATVMDWVGHDEMKMVLHYYRLRDDAAQKAMERFTIGQVDAAAAG